MTLNRPLRTFGPRIEHRRVSIDVPQETWEAVQEFARVDYRHAKDEAVVLLIEAVAARREKENSDGV